MRAPEFWRHRGPLPALLLPAAMAFAAAGGMRRLVVRPWRAPVPVVCVGNLVAGGAGKTPVAIALARRLIEAGRDVHFLTRGHGGAEAGPLRVDPLGHDFRAVGDEALLLARVAPTWVSRDRAAGARAAIEAGAAMLVMDDGHQNPGLAKDVSLVVADGVYGFGNGLPMPAGPLRETVAVGLARADALIVVGPDQTGLAARAAGLPVVGARLRAAGAAVPGRVLAFAGIGRPAKFFDSLAGLGAELAATRAFPDHHPFTRAEVAALLDEARRLGAVPVTTEKDAVRLPPDLARGIAVLRIEAVFDDPAALDAVLLAGGV